MTKKVKISENCNKKTQGKKCQKIKLKMSENQEKNVRKKNEKCHTTDKKTSEKFLRN